MTPASFRALQRRARRQEARRNWPNLPLYAVALASVAVAWVLVCVLIVLVAQ